MKTRFIPTKVVWYLLFIALIAGFIFGISTWEIAIAPNRVEESKQEGFMLALKGFGLVDTIHTSEQIGDSTIITIK